MADLKGFVQDYYKAWDAGDERWKKMLSPDLKARFNGGDDMDLDGFMGAIDGFQAGFSGFRHDLGTQAVDGDIVFTRLFWNAKHTGEFAGVAATGKDVRARVVLVMRIEKGLITDYEVVIDMGGLMGQITGG